MADLATASNAKVLFRALQAAHHYTNFSRTPRAFHKFTAKMSVFIRPAMVDEDLRQILFRNNQRWSAIQISALKDHYERCFHRALGHLTLRDRLTAIEFESAFNSAIRWCRNQMGKSLLNNTIDTTRKLCRACIQQGMNPPPLPNYANPGHQPLVEPRETYAGRVSQPSNSGFTKGQSHGTPSSATNGPQTARPLNISCPTQFPELNSSQGNGPAATGSRVPPTHSKLGGHEVLVDRSKTAPRSEQPQTAPARPAAIEKSSTNGASPSKRVDRPKLTNWVAVQGREDPLSNFYPSVLDLPEGRVPSGEHAYQLIKAQYFSNKYALQQIRRAPNAGKAKRISDEHFKSKQFKQACRENPNLARRNSTWLKTQSRLACLRVLKLKLDQCEPFKTALRNSGDCHIIHNVSSSYWGTGSTNPHSLRGSGGANTFGKLLMEVRRDLWASDRKRRISSSATAPPQATISSTQMGITNLDSIEVSKLSSAPTINAERKVEEEKATTLAQNSDIAKPDENQDKSPVMPPVEKMHIDVVARAQGPTDHIEKGDSISGAAFWESLQKIPSPSHTISDSPNSFIESQTTTPGQQSPTRARSCSPLPQRVPKIPKGKLTKGVTVKSSSQDSHTVELRPDLGSLLAGRSPSLTLPRIDQLGDIELAQDTPIPKKKSSPRFITFSVPEERKKARIKHHTGANKEAWVLPPLGRPIVVIGDSNIKRISNISTAYIQQTTLVSYSGMSFKHLYEVFRRMAEPDLQVKHLILAVGINNRYQNAEKSANKVIQSLYSKARLQFPRAKVYFPTFPKYKDPSWNINLGDFTKTFKRLGATILQPTQNFKLDDEVHWSPSTADDMLQEWLSSLNF